MNNRVVLIFFSLLTAVSGAFAQNFALKSVALVPNDLEARTKPRNDNNGRPCAIIKVGIVNVDDMLFPDAIGDVKHDASEYVIYVPDGLKSLKYSSASYGLSGVINLSNDYDIEIEQQRTYRILFDREDHLRAAIFIVEPKDAKLIVDGKNVKLDEFGMSKVVLPVGDYSYNITADGYNAMSGRVNLGEDELSQTVGVSLEQRLHFVSIAVEPQNATLFLDDKPLPLLSGMYRIPLGEGKHKVRLTAENHQDFEKSIKVTKDMYIECKMKEAKSVVVMHDDQKSKMASTIRNFFYFSGGVELFNKNNEANYRYGLKLELGCEINFLRVLTIRPLNISVGAVAMKVNEEDRNPVSLEYSPSLGFIMPFYYNKHMFSALFGGYYRWNVRVDEVSEKQYDWDTTKDYGLKLEALVYIHKFFMGIEGRKSLRNNNFSGAVKVGLRFYL